MALTDSLPTQDSGGLSIVDHRLINAGDLVCSSTGVPRLGLLTVATPNIVTSMASMAVSVLAFVAAVSRTNSGAEKVANTGATTVSVTAAPASNSRIDVVWVRPQFVASSDAANVPLFGVTAGTASGSPVKPAIPAGALELATILIPSTATTTQSAGVVITQTFQYTANSGGVVQMRSDAEMVAWAPTQGQQAYRMDTKQMWTYDGSNWSISQAGMVLIRPGAVTNGSIAADGTIIPNVGATNIRIDDAFTSRYRHFRIVGSFAFNAACNLRMRLTSGGVERAGLVYFSAATYSNPLVSPVGGGSFQWHEGTAGEWFIQVVESARKVITLDVFNPAIASEWTVASGLFGSFGSAFSHQSWSGSYETNNANDGLNIWISSGGGIFQSGCNLKVYAYA